MKKRSQGNKKTAARIQELKVATGVCIKKLRIDCELMQEQVAEIMGWSEAVQSEIEKGRRNVTVPELIALAEGMRENPDVLIRNIREWKRRPR